MTSQSRAERRCLFFSFFFFCPLFMSSAAAGCATGGRTDCFDMRRRHRGRFSALGLLEAPEMASDSASAGGPSSFPGCPCSFDFMQRLRKEPAIQIEDCSFRQVCTRSLISLVAREIFLLSFVVRQSTHWKISRLQRIPPGRK